MGIAEIRDGEVAGRGEKVVWRNNARGRNKEQEESEENERCAQMK